MSCPSIGDVRIDSDTGDLQVFYNDKWNHIYIIPDPKPFVTLELTDEPNPSNFLIGAVRIDPITGKLQIFSGRKWINLPNIPTTHSQDSTDSSLPSSSSIEDWTKAYERAKKAVADM